MWLWGSDKEQMIINGKCGALETPQFGPHRSFKTTSLLHTTSMDPEVKLPTWGTQKAQILPFSGSGKVSYPVSHLNFDVGVYYDSIFYADDCVAPLQWVIISQGTGFREPCPRQWHWFRYSIRYFFLWITSGGENDIGRPGLPNYTTHG